MPYALFYAFCLTLFGVVSGSAQFILVEQGGSFAPGNLATAGTAFALNEIDIPPHTIDGVNDGVYGNSSSWIGATLDSNVGVILSAPSGISAFAFGRDNTGVYADRAAGMYTFHYSTDPISGFNPLTATWNLIGQFSYDPTYFPYIAVSNPAERHAFNLATPLTGVTAFRITTEGAPMFGVALAIDEIELYASPIPEPSTLALAGLALVMAVAGRRLLRRS